MMDVSLYFFLSFGIATPSTKHFDSGDLRQLIINLQKNTVTHKLNLLIFKSKPTILSNKS